MKAIYLICFFFLSVNAVINQEAQKREAPAFPQKSYGPPHQQQQINHKRLQAMQRILQAMRNGGYSPQGRVINRPRPIPVQNSYAPPPPPQNNYGPPVAPQKHYGPPSGGYSSSSGSLAAFTHNHNPDVRCDGWIPIPGPSIAAGGSASSGGHIDSSYGTPNHIQGGTLSTVIVVPEDTSYHGGSAGSIAAIEQSYGVPAPPQAPQSSYGTPHSFSSGSLSTSNAVSSIDQSYGVPPPPQAPQNTYGTPHSFSGGSASSSASVGSIDQSYGVPAPPPIQPHNTYGPPVVPIQPQNTYGTPNSFSGGSASSSHSHGSLDTSFGIPEPPANPQSGYGPPAEGHSSSGHSSSGHSSSSHSVSSSVAAIDTSYGVPPEPVHPQSTYGTPNSGGHAHSIDSSYGPPIIVGSGHASSASAIASIDNSYGPPAVPQPAPVVENTYLPPHTSNFGHANSGHIVGHQTYGPPEKPVDFGPPESSYGPPPSGAVDFKHSVAGNIGSIDSIPSLPTDIQAPHGDSGAHFDNAIGLVSSTLGVSAGNSEVIKSHAIHESHTSEVAHVNSISSSGSVSSGHSDSYSAPPLDSYAPGKYAPSFLTRRPPVPTPPARPIAPVQRPLGPPPQRPIQPRPQYIPPIPQKQLLRPQIPPPSFRPIPAQHGGHAQSIAHSYASQSHSQSHHQQAPPRPIRPLIHRQPVPQGLIQSIGQTVQVQDAHRGISSSSSTYLPPPTHDVPIPPMNLIVPASGNVQQFHSHSHGSGVATSSASFSLQNQELRHVHVIHDCGKGPQLSNTYGTPLAPPLTSYGTPNTGDSHSAVLSTSYEIPAQGLEVPQHSSVGFNAPSNSYGPPASGSASLDVVGLESRANAVVVSEPQPAESNDNSQATLPGLSGGLSSSGLDFISAVKSHTIDVPQNQAAASNIQYHIQGSQSEHQDNRIDGADHQQILADGLLQSILSAVEKQPSQTVPQVTEDVEVDHSEAKTFLKSREGQEVLADKSKDDAGKK